MKALDSAPAVPSWDHDPVPGAGKGLTALSIPIGTGHAVQITACLYQILRQILKICSRRGPILKMLDSIL